jgi:hypothetical protein
MVLIGPKRAGKSKIYCSLTGKDYDEVKDTPSPLPGTSSGQSRMRVRVVASIVDTPGENMGQHLAAAINFRTDVLALVLNSKAIDMAALRQLQLAGALSPVNEFCDHALRNNVQEGNINLGNKTREYLQALMFATRGSAVVGGMAPNNALVVDYRVHTFALVLYHASQADVDAPAQERLEQLAVAIGKFFDVHANRCKFMNCPVAQDNGQINSQPFVADAADLALSN